MKLKFMAIISCALSLIAPAHALDTVTSNITLNGTVDKFCFMQAPIISGDGSGTPGANADAIASFINFVELDGTHLPHTLNITFPNAMCNYSASLGLKSTNGGMKPHALAPASFAGIVYYTATATWGTAITKMTTSLSSTGDNNAVLVPPTSADLTLKIVTAATGKPLIADGTPYSDTLIIQLGQPL
jgi:hypothetical protein